MASDSHQIYSYNKYTHHLCQFQCAVFVFFKFLITPQIFAKMHINTSTTSQQFCLARFVTKFFNLPINFFLTSCQMQNAFNTHCRWNTSIQARGHFVYGTYGTPTLSCHVCISNGKLLGAPFFDPVSLQPQKHNSAPLQQWHATARRGVSETINSRRNEGKQMTGNLQIK